MSITLEGYRPNQDTKVKLRLKQLPEKEFNFLRSGSEEATSELLSEVCQKHCLAYAKSCNGIGMVSAWRDIMEARKGNVDDERCLIPGKTITISEDGIKLQS